ncbi:hypothetical protein QR98_0057720 [Sarcoptes scabiei]|uniref:Uncharacterized protein n=1 Tax=Sarcoptes scabiei TaxID=52283 RepID=A0A132A8K0_SARSC|nr:hypothetical protein QR98_0057720 [Sarcoptes scabiei]
MRNDRINTNRFSSLIIPPPLLPPAVPPKLLLVRCGIWFDIKQSAILQFSTQKFSKELDEKFRRNINQPAKKMQDEMIDSNRIL